MDKAVGINPQVANKNDFKGTSTEIFLAEAKEKRFINAFCSSNSSSSNGYEFLVIR